MDKLIYIGAGIFVFLLVVVCVFAFRKNGEDEDIDNMSGTDFEDFIAEILHRSGIEVLELTKASGDFGADIIVLYEGERTAVQCKRYSRPIGVKAVQEAVSSKDYYKCTRSAVITNSTFTRQATELAEESGVILWDREDVFAFMKKAEARDKTPLETKTAVRFHRLISGEHSEELLLINVNGEEYKLPSEKMTVITVHGSKADIFIRHRHRKTALSLTLNGKTRDIVAGVYKNKGFLEEIC